MVKLSKQFVGNSRWIVWVCLTILGDWRFKKRLKDIIIEIYGIKFSKLNVRVDSQIVLKYIQSTNRHFLVFIMSRLNEVRLNSNISDWKFIPGNLNRADLCTWYNPFSQLKTNKLRFNDSEYAREKAGESILDLENIEQLSI